MGRHTWNEALAGLTPDDVDMLRKIVQGVRSLYHRTIMHKDENNKIDDYYPLARREWDEKLMLVFEEFEWYENQRTSIQNKNQYEDIVFIAVSMFGDGYEDDEILAFIEEQTGAEKRQAIMLAAKTIYSLKENTND